MRLSDWRGNRPAEDASIIWLVLLSMYTLPGLKEDCEQMTQLMRAHDHPIELPRLNQPSLHQTLPCKPTLVAQRAHTELQHKRIWATRKTTLQEHVHATKRVLCGRDGSYWQHRREATILRGPSPRKNLYGLRYHPRWPCSYDLRHPVSQASLGQPFSTVHL